MVIHSEAVDEPVLVQLKSAFQTVITIEDTKAKAAELNQFSALNLNQIFKFTLKIDNRNLTKGKVYPYVRKLKIFDSSE